MAVTALKEGMLDNLRDGKIIKEAEVSIIKKMEKAIVDLLDGHLKTLKCGGMNPRKSFKMLGLTQTWENLHNFLKTVQGEVKAENEKKKSLLDKELDELEEKEKTFAAADLDPKKHNQYSQVLSQIKINKQMLRDSDDAERNLQEMVDAHKASVTCIEQSGSPIKPIPSPPRKKARLTFSFRDL